MAFAGDRLVSAFGVGLLVASVVTTGRSVGRSRERERLDKR